MDMNSGFNFTVIDGTTPHRRFLIFGSLTRIGYPDWFKKVASEEMAKTLSRTRLFPYDISTTRMAAPSVPNYELGLELSSHWYKESRCIIYRHFLPLHT